MKKYALFCCACWAIGESSSFLAANGGASLNPVQFAAHANHLGNSDRSTPAAARRHRPSSAVMLGTRQGSDSWAGKVASAVVAVAVLVGASVVAPLDAVAARAPKQEPVVQALVQLPDEEVDWTKLLSNVDEAPGANMVITASKERGSKPSLGASIAMERLKFPVMMQLFPKNVLGGANWPGDFEEKGTYSVEVVVCGPGRVTGGVCEVPLPIVGSGESIFVTGLDDVPEIAESGGMRVPATVVLTSPSEKVLAPP